MSRIDSAACAGLIEPLTAIAIAAAEAIRHTQGDGGVNIKADGSPVTAADEASDAVIIEGLKRVAPDVPVISEESGHASSGGERSSYFLVDPLDGTREFIAGIAEYTVNIAILTDGVPLLGVIAAPAQNVIWRGIVGRGAERLSYAAQGASAPQSIRARPRPQDELVVMVSRSHLEARTQAYLDGFPRTRRIGCGSSVKFCRIAEGAADLYPRLAPTHDWDIAAGHAILVAAGGSVVAPEGGAVAYGSPELLIPSFIAWGGPPA